MRGMREGRITLEIARVRPLGRVGPCFTYFRVGLSLPYLGGEKATLGRGAGGVRIESLTATSPVCASCLETITRRSIRTQPANESLLRA